MIRTLLLVAFGPEWDALLPRVVDAQHHADRIVTGTLAGQKVVVAETGIGMVNAAMTTQRVIDRFEVERILLSGVAGSIDRSVPLGAVVVPRRWGHFLEVGMGRSTPGGYTLPPLPGETDLPPHGMMIPRDVVTADGARRWFEADGALLVAAQAAGVSLCEAGLSGSAFVDNAPYRDYLAATFGAQIVDMESAAVAQVAAAAALPFLAMRAVSDLAGGEADANALPTTLTIAASACAAAVERLVAALPVEATVDAA